MLSGGDAIAARARIAPDRIAAVDADTGSASTYRALDEWVNRIACVLAEETGRVGVVLEPAPAVGAVVAGTWRAGRSAVLLDPREPAESLSRLTERAAVTTVVCSEQTADIAGAIDISRVVQVESTARGTTATPRDDDCGCPPDEEALVVFTSGSAGEPKGVRLSHRNLTASAVASGLRLGVDPEDRWLCCLPTHHMGGLSPFIRSWLTGTTVVTQQSFDVSETVAVIEEEAVSLVSLVPTMCRRLLEDGWEPGPQLRVVLLGGAPATPALLERCLEAGVPVHPTYGATETASQVATARPRTVERLPGTVGRPLQGTSVRVVDDGTPCPPGTVGALQVTGPTVMQGYLDADRTSAAFAGEWLVMGDYGRLDESGHLFVVGREADRILTGGETVDALEVARVLESDPAVAAAAVVGLPDAEWGERVAALLETAPESPLEAGEQVESAQARLPPHKRPKVTGVCASLPRTDSGTIDRAAVRGLLEREGTDVGNRQ